MIRSLDDAGKWYKAVRTLAYVKWRLASKLDDPTLEVQTEPFRPV
jgi:hypothetical protein